MAQGRHDDAVLDGDWEAHAWNAVASGARGGHDFRARVTVDCGQLRAVHEPYERVGAHTVRRRRYRRDIVVATPARRGTPNHFRDRRLPRLNERRDDHLLAVRRPCGAAATTPADVDRRVKTR